MGCGRAATQGRDRRIPGDRHRENPLRIFSVDLSGTATSVRVPTESLERNVRYKFEVLAIEAGGNQTLTERSFVAR